MASEALRSVFRNSSYLLLALCVSALVFLFAVWFSNLELIAEVLSSPSIPLLYKISIPLSLLGSITTNFTAFSGAYTIIIALLFGIYVAMFTYFLRKRIKEVGGTGVATGFFGMISGVLGIGCAACGSFLLTSVLSALGATGALAVLPFDGKEFAILGIILLLESIKITAKQITDPLVCKIS